MRRKSRIDSNQGEIVEALKAIGCTIMFTHQLGKGYPDFVAGHTRDGIAHNYLIEVKDGSLSPSKRRLTKDEEIFHNTWRGQVAVVNSVKEALELILGQTLVD